MVREIGERPFVEADLAEGIKSLMQLRDQRKVSVAGAVDIQKK